MPDPTPRHGVLRRLLRTPVFLGLLSLVVLLLGLGTVVYRLTEPRGLCDPLYLSVITPTTIGCGEPAPQAVRPGPSRSATPCAGIGLIVALAGQIAEAVIDSHVESSRDG